LEQNREVMAVPGNITSELSQGANLLIQSGAKPITGWQDVAEELPSPLREELLSQEEKKEVPAAMNLQERRIFDVLKTDSLTHIDDLVDRASLSVSEVLTILLSLELKGLIVQSPGKYFQRSW
jgi:DNA processing protein